MLFCTEMVMRNTVRLQIHRCWPLFRLTSVTSLIPALWLLIFGVRMTGQ